MEKAILVTDMPDNCVDCVLFCDEDCFCQYNWQDTMHDDHHPGKPDWCPLIPEPERKTEDISVSFVSDIRRDDLDKIIEMGKIAGWNACIDYLEGKI